MSAGKLSTVGAIAVAALVASSPATALTVHTDLASWTLAVQAGSVLVEDFQNYALGSNILDVKLDKVPVVKLTTNLSAINVIRDPYKDNKIAFASERSPDGVSGVIANLDTPVTAVAFEILGYDGNTPVPAFLFVQFGDGSITKMDLERDSGEPYEPYFIGLTALEKGGLMRFGFQEPSNRDGSCCNAVGWDNLAVAAAVPEPKTYALMFAGLMTVFWLGARRNKRS